LSAVKKDLAKRTNEVEALKKEIAALKTTAPDAADLERLQQTLAEREAELAALKEASSSDSQELAALKITAAKRTNEVEALRKEMAALKTTTPKTGELESLKQTLAEREAELASLRTAIEDTTELDALKKSVADKEKEIAALKESLRGSQDELKRSLLEEKEKIAALEKKIADAENKSADYRKLQSEYASYSRNEDTVVRTGSLEELVVSKSYLDSFLSSRTMQSAFPGLLERIKRYDRAFETTGRESAVRDTVRVIRAANALPTKEEKISYLQKRLAGVRSTDPMSVLLKSLIDLISE
jgi:chromosome segregation ATPase